MNSGNSRHRGTVDIVRIAGISGIMGMMGIIGSLKLSLVMFGWVIIRNLKFVLQKDQSLKVA